LGKERTFLKEVRKIFKGSGENWGEAGEFGGRKNLGGRKMKDGGKGKTVL
jgi:hypothetical protein